VNSLGKNKATIEVTDPQNVTLEKMLFVFMLPPMES
jgi:hypothetical protein